MGSKLVFAVFFALSLTACTSVVNDDDIADEEGEDYYGPKVIDFPNFTLPQNWSVTENNENYIRMDGEKYFVTLSYQEPELANGLEDYDYLGVTEAGPNVFATYTRLVGPADPQIIYALVLENKKLSVVLGYGEAVIQDEVVMSILSSLIYENN